MLLDRTMMTFYKVSIVAMCSFAAVLPQFVVKVFCFLVAVSQKRWEIELRLLLMI